MRLHKSLLLFGVSSLLLVACGDDDGSSAEKESNDPEVEEVEAQEEDNNKVIDIDEEVASDETLNATLVYAEYDEGDEFDFGEIKIVFEVENVSEKDIEIQARSVSIDDHMVDESLISMSQEVVSGKSAKAILKLVDYDDEPDFPELVGNLEMKLHVFDWDDHEFEKDYDVNVELN